ncbi:MAG: hypothetical protein ACXU81_15485, partial [Myxococcaceae bacterium]
MRRLLLGLALLGCARGGPPPDLFAAARAPAATPSEALSLGQALQAAHLDAASLGPLRIAGAVSGPAQAPAIEALLGAQERLDEQLLVPAFLLAHPDAQPATPGGQERALLVRGLEAQ